MESAISSGTQPIGWQKDKWGENTTTFAYLNTGYTGSRSVKVTISKYTSGDAKWYFNPIPVSPNASYNFSDELNKEKESVAGVVTPSKIPNWLLWWQYFTK